MKPYIGTLPNNFPFKTTGIGNQLSIANFVKTKTFNKTVTQFNANN